MASVDARENLEIKLPAFSVVELVPPALATLASCLATCIASVVTILLHHHHHELLELEQ